MSILNAVLPFLTESTKDGFDLYQMGKNVGSYVEKIAQILMMLIGVILVIVAVIQIAKGLAGGGRGQTNWVMSIACLLIGGALLVGGWGLISGVAEAGNKTLENATGTQVDQGNNDHFGGSKGKGGT